MDSFYEQLDETIREFNANLSFKEAELAQTKALTEAQIGLNKRQLDINQEQYKSDLTLRRQALKEQTNYQTGMLKVEERKTSLLESKSAESAAASAKAFDFLSKYMTGQDAALNATGSTGTASSSSTMVPARPRTTVPQSGEINYGYSSENEYVPLPPGEGSIY